MVGATATKPTSTIGMRSTRFDAAEKVTGQARYLNDMMLPGMLHGAFLLAAHPHARILSIDTSEAEAMAGVRAIVTYRDVPDMRYGALVKDQRLFAKEGEKVTFLGEVVAAVAASSLEIARAATKKIKVDYEVLAPILDPEAALAEGAALVHPAIEEYSALEGTIKRGNDCGYSTIVKGDIGQGIADADVVVEERYVVDHSHPAAIEPHGVLAQVDAGGRATIWSSTQVPYVARAGVAETLGLPLSKVRIIVPSLGGGFGGKCEFAFEAHVAALARKAGRPVKVVFSRAEEFIMPNMTRHGAVVYIKTGVKKDGTITARQANVILDTGGTAAHGPACSEIATMMVVGPYRIPHLAIEGHSVYTNKISAGSVRAPTGPQVCWATEQHTDSLARAIGMDAVEFRMKNLVEKGDLGPTGQIFEDVGVKECLKQAAELIGWQQGAAKPGEGVGVACGWWFTLGLPSSVTLKLNDDGTVTLLTGANENGSGAVQGLIHLVAEEMGIPISDISVVYQDTDVGGWDGGSSGSQTVFSVGRAVQRASEDLRQQIRQIASDMLEVDPADLELREAAAHVRGTPGRLVTLGDVAARASSTVGPLSGRGAASGAALPEAPGAAGCAGRVTFPSFLAPTFCAHAARVIVDEETGMVRVTDAAAAQEVGRAINPVGVEGQMEGGLVHGMGNALTERTQYQDGRMINNGFTDYKLITAADAPEIRTAIIETASSEGPYGARGVGEPPVVAIAGAIGNAIRSATGARVTRMPMTPDRVYAALKERGGKEA
jgi:CO/xanthine dehydrogenase Mo-binding subunit